MKTIHIIKSFVIISFYFICTCSIVSCNKNSGDISTNDSINNTVQSPLITDSQPYIEKKSIIHKDSVELRLTNDFLLPPIKSVNFILAQTSLEYMHLNVPNYKDSLSKFLRYYNRRLPDFGRYKTYFINVSCSQDSASKCICNSYTDYNGLSYGLLVFYDPNSCKANIMNVSYDFSSNSSHYEMSYTIEPNNTIILHENGQTEGEGGEPEELGERKRIIKLTKDGLIQILGDE